MEFPYEKDNKERIPLEHYLEEYRQIEPKEAASRCGIEYDGEKRHLTGGLSGVRPSSGKWRGRGSTLFRDGSG